MILSDDLGVAICKAMGIDTEGVQRIVIDLRPFEPIHVQIEMLGTEELLGVDFFELADVEAEIVGAK